MFPDLETSAWIVGALTALLVGVSKTGIPGAGILAVPVMATLFDGKASVGMLLPMLITADVFAVWYHHRSAQWDKVWELLPWVVAGAVVAAVVLVFVGDQPQASTGETAAVNTGRDPFKILIGCVVIVMLIVRGLRHWLGDRLTPSTGIAVAGTGALTGFATTLANAAGPVMTLYLAGMKMPKARFMGTNAWFFLILNVAKVPVYLLVDQLSAGPAMISAESLAYNLLMAPIIVAGCGLGILAFRGVPQRLFDILVLVLAAAAAVQLFAQW